MVPKCPNVNSKEIRCIVQESKKDCRGLGSKTSRTCGSDSFVWGAHKGSSVAGRDNYKVPSASGR